MQRIATASLSISLCFLLLSPTLADDSTPAVQMLVPGFSVWELPAKVTNLVNIQYSPDGRLFAAGYDGRIHMLRDSDGDGLEDEVVTIWDTTSTDYPLGLAVHANSLYVLLSHELVRFRDTNDDGIPETREVVLKDWDDPSLMNHPLILRRRVDFAMGLAISQDGSIYIGMGNGAFSNAYMLDGEGVLGDRGKSHYSPLIYRGCVLKFSPDGKEKELYVSGVRYLMCMQFNQHGDLFATDQEGATWLPNGNPFDELLQLQPSRHYGFPPRHPKFLPNVIDEPSVFDYTPQHQSLCGFRFNEGVGFGPTWWKGDALLAGFSRGKLYRTKLIKRDTGYVAQNQLIGTTQSLAADVTLSPTGDLLLASHSGEPDWGTGPTGQGHLYKIRFSNRSIPVPTAAWSAGPGEFRIAFDHPLEPKQLKDLAKQLRIKAGRFVSAGDQFETLRPGYDVVTLQQAAPRREISVLSTSLAADEQTLIINTTNCTAADNYAISLPGLQSPSKKAGEIQQLSTIEMLADLHGVVAQWGSDAAMPTSFTWLPHADLDVAKQLTSPSIEHQSLFQNIRSPGTLTIKGQLDLWQMLQPAIQPNSHLDHDRPLETVEIHFSGPQEFQVQFDSTNYESSLHDGVHRITVKHLSRDGRWLPFEISLATGFQDPMVHLDWSTSDDSRRRSFPLRRFLLPWATSATDPSMAAVDRAKLPELSGANLERGRTLFMGAAKCSSCHRLRGEGAKIGPDLSNLIHRDYQSVLRDIRTPSAAINPDYLSYSISLKSGKVFTGVISSEDQNVVKLADNTGKILEIARSEIEEISASKTSLMPDGLTKDLSAEQLRDLMGFLLLEPMRR